MPRPALHSVNLVLTAGCNLSCSYCYQNAKQPAARMEEATVHRAVDVLLASPRRVVMLGFYGGEPLLRFDMIRQAVEYAERRKPPGKILRYATITNGTLLREEQAEFLARHRVRTQLSFDGVPAAQAERGARTYPVLDALLDRLRREHPLWFAESLSVSMTLVPMTVGHIADSIEYFFGKRVPRIRFSPLVTDSSSWRVERIEELDAQFEHVFRRSVELYEETGEVPIEGFRKEHAEDVHAPRARSLCGAPGGDSLAVDVDGRVYGCETFAESFQKFSTPFLRGQLEPLRLGKIDAPDLAGKLEAYPRIARGSEIFHEHQNKHSSYGRCAACRYFSECTVCPISIGNIPGNEDPLRIPDFVCAYNLVINKYRERFPWQDGVLELLEGRQRVPRLMREVEALAAGMGGSKR